jgi:hypothetical protein
MKRLLIVVLLAVLAGAVRGRRSRQPMSTPAKVSDVRMAVAETAPDREASAAS